MKRRPRLNLIHFQMSETFRLSPSLSHSHLYLCLASFLITLFIYFFLSLFLRLSLSLSLCFTSFPFFQSINPSFFFLTFTSSFLFSRYLLLCSHYSLSFSFLSFFLSFFLHSYFHPSHSLYFFLSLSLSVTHSLLHFFYLVISIFLLKKNVPTRASFCLFSFFSNTNFTEKTVGFSKIRTRIVGVEG